ncbi:MAG: glutaredoxin [Chloroflexi bacterium]|nr:MAG: glutaredoxin [Chloroflexota bacterium]
MEKLLSEDIQKQVVDALQQVKEPVQVLFFSSQENCDYCNDTKQLLEEVVELSDKVSIDVYDLDTDREIAQKYQIEKAPAFIIAAKNGDEIVDYGIRFYGIPSGHEFSSLIHDLILVSGRDSGLNPQTREFLAELKNPVHLMVFVTPTCPYCPRAVVLAHQMAMESPMVVADGIEATEFPDLADQFFVSGVPQTTINMGAGTVIGAVPEQHLLNEIRKVAAEKVEAR